MSDNLKVKIRLQGHEKFTLREGWLNKGIIMVNRDATAFQGKNGPDIFGIGNNMVKSLRYWLKAFGLIYEIQGKGTYLSEIGKLILEYDPYFEDIFSLWILHSHIARNIEDATSWYMFFNKDFFEDLEKEQIELILLREITKYAGSTTFSDKSIKNDLDVLLNMYSKEKGNFDPEDKNSSPFSQLNLIKNINGRYSRNHLGTKYINKWVVLFELANLLKDKDFISIEEAIEAEKGLAKIYQLNAVSANELLDQLESYDYIKINRTAGLDVIYKINNFTPEGVIENYYKSRK